MSTYKKKIIFEDLSKQKNHPKNLTNVFDFYFAQANVSKT